MSGPNVGVADDAVVEPSGEVPALRARGLTKLFSVGMFSRGRTVHAVEDFSVDLWRRQVVALVGESGSGKSTVARLLAQTLPATAGRIELDGAAVAVRTARGLRSYCHDVQMIFQDPFASLNSIHTVRYTLGRSVAIHHRGLSSGEKTAQIEALLEKVKLTPAGRFIDKYPHELSGGQRQRIAIARTLAASPKVLLADEPISMLDVSMRLGILNLLADLRDDMGLAVLYITHDVASARYFADRTMVMYAGRIVEAGDSETLTQHPAHPYTQLLVASAPDPDHLSGEAIGARGEPPSLIDPPPGCRFHPRCPLATVLCQTQSPPLMDVGDGHQAACWAYSTQPGAPTMATADSGDSQATASDAATRVALDERGAR
ncbi:MAG: ABC transporter ATP-binding protein [Propionibacteriaceae bacterium]|nr:ABC transporter ATP-binding protein [Propionibacteriaceae bacterium]